MGKILVIDDERPIRRTLCEILEFEKFEVDQAENGEQGLKMIQENEYDVILCDIKMPKMDGMEVLEKVKKLDHNPTIVMISGHGTIDTAVDALKKGAFDYLPKPTDLNRLLVTVRNAINKKELVEETKVLKKNLTKSNQQKLLVNLKQLKQLYQ
jgi:DNA-binding NtrC family response regulator